MAYVDTVVISTSPTNFGSAGVQLAFASRRPFRVLGYRAACISSHSGQTAAPALQLRVDGSVVDTMTLTTARSVAGQVTERSELLRGVGPLTAPDAFINAFDVAPGRVVDVNVSTAEAGATLARWVLHLLIQPAGSL